MKILVNGEMVEADLGQPAPAMAVPPSIDYVKLRRSVTAGIMRAFLWTSLIASVVAFLGATEDNMKTGCIGGMVVCILGLIAAMAIEADAKRKAN